MAFSAVGKRTKTKKMQSKEKWIRVTAEPSRTRVQTVARTSDCDTAARSSAHFYFM